MVRGLGSFASIVVATAVVAIDGSGDFTDIQSAIDSLPAGGGVVYIKEGTDTITSTISITSDGIALIGAGYSSKIFVVNGANIDAITVEDADFIIIDSIQIDGNRANQSNSDVGIRLGSTGKIVTKSTIRNCWIHDIDGNGIVFFTGSSGVTISDNFIWDCTGVALDIFSDNHIIINNSISDCDNSVAGMVILTNCDHNIIANNIITGAVEHGIQLDAPTGTCDRNLIVGNQIFANGGFGVDIVEAACNKNVIHGNVIFNNTDGAIDDSGTSTIDSDNLKT